MQLEVNDCVFVIGRVKVPAEFQACMEAHALELYIEHNFFQTGSVVATA